MRRPSLRAPASLGAFVVAFLSWVLFTPACSNSNPPPTPASFDRPDSLAFFCWDLTDDVVTELTNCKPDRNPATLDEDTGQPAVGVEPPVVDHEFALHVFVAQTSSGELAAVRVTGVDGEAGVIDGDVRIPGFTFAPVGEVPSAVVTSPTDPKFVYVLSRGSGLVESFATAAFRKGLGTRRAAFVALPIGSRPNAMLLTPDQSALVIALPDTGQLARVPLVGEGDFGEVAYLDLAVDVPPPVDISLVPDTELPPTYRTVCPAGLVQFEPPVLAPREPLSLGPVPEPWELLFDPETGELLVADRTLPIIHVVDASTSTMVEAAPISVSVPTRALALSPRVPATFGDLAPSERFLYAIDETDYSVLVIDLTGPARGSYRAVIPVNVSPPYDRLGAPLPARALAVVAPAYDLNESPPQVTCETPPEGQTPSGVNLHGVFLTVATVDGRIRFFDIFDLDAACRGVDCASLGVADPEDKIVAIGRHRPRLGSYLQDGVQVTPDPSWNTDGGGAATVASTGSTTARDLVPDLVPVTCAAPLAPVFPPAPGDALICAVTDPWASISERFSVSYEGRIPFSGTSGANFDEVSGDSLEIRGDPCGLGVLGSGDVPADGYLADYLGDVVAITGDLPPSILAGDELDATTDQRDRFDRCVQLTQRTTSGATTPVILPILNAWTRPDGIRDTYTGRLDIGPPAGYDSLDVVRECFPELLELEIRAQGSFVVESSRQGFLHSVVRAVDGACRVDPDLDARLRRGRAFFGQLYSSPYVTFQLGATGAPAPISIGRPNLDFTVGDVPTPLTIDASSVGGSDRSSLLSRLVYNRVDQRLYAVDQSVQGLLRIRLTNLTVQQTFR